MARLNGKHNNPWFINRWSKVVVGAMTLVSGLSVAHQIGSKHADELLSGITPLYSSAKQPLAKQTYFQALANATSSTPVIDSSYRFEGNINDEASDYVIRLEGEATEAYEAGQTGSAFSLRDRTWLELPAELHDNIQLDQSLSISIDFKYENDGVDESVWVILSNKDWAYDVPGLKIEAWFTVVS